jgi:uncharacterized Zn finger protein
MAAKRGSGIVFDRADQYIDTPFMTRRVRNGMELSVRIEGNYGVYRTQVRIDRPSEASCTCPSELWPCKHVRALLETWKVNPESFFDIGLLLKGLANRRKSELLELIGKMALAAPESLRACGVKGFEEEGEENEE